MNVEVVGGLVEEVLVVVVVGGLVEEVLAVVGSCSVGAPWI